MCGDLFSKLPGWEQKIDWRQGVKPSTPLSSATIARAEVDSQFQQINRSLWDRCFGPNPGDHLSACVAASNPPILAKRVPFFRFSLVLATQDDGRPVRQSITHWGELRDETLISLTKDYPHEQLIRKQLAKMQIACKRRQTVNLLDTQIGLVEAGLGIAVIPSFGVLALRDRKVRITQLDPLVTLEFYEISNRGRKLQPEAIEFGGFLKTYIARQVSDK